MLELVPANLLQCLKYETITEPKRLMENKEKKIDIHVRMRLIGYYMSEEQFMRTESIFPEDAEELSALFKQSFNSLLHNKYVDDDIMTVLNGNTVFILKGENRHLYGYYPRYNIARITSVHYAKDVVTPMPLKYKRWFIPGERIKLINEVLHE